MLIQPRGKKNMLGIKNNKIGINIFYLGKKGTQQVWI